VSKAVLANVEISGPVRSDHRAVRMSFYWVRIRSTTAPAKLEQDNKSRCYFAVGRRLSTRSSQDSTLCAVISLTLPLRITSKAFQHATPTPRDAKVAVTLPGLALMNQQALDKHPAKRFVPPAGLGVLFKKNCTASCQRPADGL